MIVGIGVDVVDVPRFAATLARTPRLLPRLFAPAERVLKPRSLAARYAAKEALIKALGGSDGVHWTDIEVASEQSGRPVFSLSGETAATVAGRGITALHLSMSHDAGLATAYVIAEASGVAAPPAAIAAPQPAPPVGGSVIAPDTARRAAVAARQPAPGPEGAHPASMPTTAGTDDVARPGGAHTPAGGGSAIGVESAASAPDTARKDTA